MVLPLWFYEVVYRTLLLGAERQLQRLSSSTNQSFYIGKSICITLFFAPVANGSRHSWLPASFFEVPPTTTWFPRSDAMPFQRTGSARVPDRKGALHILQLPHAKADRQRAFRGNPIHWVASLARLLNAVCVRGY